MLNASVGVQRAIGRLRRPPSSRASSATAVAVSLAGALHLQRRVRAVAAATRLAPKLDRAARGYAAAHPTRQARISLVTRVGHDRAVALVAAAILLGASVVSVSAGRPAPATGGTTGPGAEVRIAVGGGPDRGGTIVEAEPPGDDLAFSQMGSIDGTDSVAELRTEAAIDPEIGAQPAAAEEATVSGPFLDDGTLLKPVAVDTTVADGRDLMETYKVKAGDTLTGIASRYGVSMMTLWRSEERRVGKECRL